MYITLAIPFLKGINNYVNITYVNYIIIYMILYFIVIIIFIIISILFYIRVKFPFWGIQPVFHIYDLHYWFYNKGIIRKELPPKNKYVNLKHIHTIDFFNIDELTKKQIVMLIRLHYLSNGDTNKYLPTINNIEPYFKGHNSKTFLSYYTEPTILIDNKSKTIETTNVIGVITSRPLHVSIYGNKFDVYYVDYLCVHKLKRKKNIATQLIQTHEYNQSYANRNISVSLFKREEELTGIVPLTIYKAYCYRRSKYITNNINNNIAYTILTGDKQNIYYFYDFMKNYFNTFHIHIFPEISNLIELIISGNIIIKMLVLDTQILCAYIFKKTCTIINSKDMLSCIASIQGDISNDEFKNGFQHTLNTFTEYYILIENISDNHLLIQSNYEYTSPMAYFFYNFAYNTFPSHKAFILC